MANIEEDLTQLGGNYCCSSCGTIESTAFYVVIYMRRISKNWGPWEDDNSEEVMCERCANIHADWADKIKPLP